MKRTRMIPAILVAGLTGLGALTQAAVAQDADWRDGHSHMRGDGRDDYGWSGQRWRDDRRDRDDDRGPRWRDDDRRSEAPRDGWRGRGDGPGWRGRGDENCGPGMGRGMGRMGPGMGRGMGPGMGRGDDERGFGRHGGHGYGGRHGMGRGYGMDRDGHGPGRGPRFGRAGGFDAADLDSVKKEIGVTAAQDQAWTKYAGAVKDASDAMKARRDAMREGVARNLSAEDHRKFRDSMMEQRRKEVDAVRSAADELVKTLDEKQVAVAKEVLPGFAFGPMRGAGMGWGGGRYR